MKRHLTVSEALDLIQLERDLAAAKRRAERFGLEAVSLLIGMAVTDVESRLAHLSTPLDGES
jgi:hypothetical protein